MIITDALGRPFTKPARETFPAGIDGTIAWMRARATYADAIASCANKAFNEGFSKGMTAH
jgi:hypothetical protein